MTTQNKIMNQKISEVVRQSNGYYIYLTNGVRILVMKFGGKITVVPPQYSGCSILKYSVKNCMVAIRQFIMDYNLGGNNKI